MKKRSVMVWMVCLLMLIMLQACSKETKNSGNNQTEVKTAPTIASTAPPTTTPEPTPAVEKIIKIDTETLKNDTGKTLFKSITKEKGGTLHTSVAIVSKSGTVIIADPNSMPKDKGLIKADIITISHGHSDHNDIFFEGPYLSGEVEGRVSQIKPESFTVKDVKVTGIAASHYSLFNKSLIPPSDVLYVYEVDGLRIAHLGDLGEDELTKEQLDQLGKLDIVFTAFDGAEAYGRSVDKCIKVLEQLKPTIVLPLHYAAEVVDKVLKKLNITDRSEMDTLAVDRKDLDNIKNPKYVFLK